MFKVPNRGREFKAIFIAVIILFLMLFAQQSIAVDKSVYYGMWKGKACGDLLSLDLSKYNIVIEINNKKINQEIKYEYTYSNISPYPFLSVLFIEENENEHLLYVVIGTGKNDDKVKLIGYYEKSRIIQDSHGEIESISEKIELVRP